MYIFISLKYIFFFELICKILVCPILNSCAHVLIKHALSIEYALFVEYALSAEYALPDKYALTV